MKDFLKSAACDVLALAMLIAIIQGCRYTNIKLDQIKAKQEAEVKKP